MKSIHIAFALAFTLAALPAGAEVINIPGSSNIFGAGHAVAPAPGGGGGGGLPPGVAIPPGTARRLTLSSVTGLTHNEGGIPAWNPDGFTFAVNLSSTGGVSGLAADKAMTLVGVFLTDSEPVNPAPSSLDFRAAGLGMGFTSLSPGINQTFLIGDGKRWIG